MKAYTLRLSALIVMTLFCLLTIVIIRHTTDSVDNILLAKVYALRTSHLTTIMQWITLLGKEVIYSVSGVIIFFFAIHRYWRQVASYIILIGGGELITTIIKVLIQRPRPTSSVINHEPSFSYPSGHSSASIIFYLLLVYWFWQKSNTPSLRVMSLIIAILIIVAVGISRIYLGAHFASDVVGGYFIGGLWLLILTSVTSIDSPYISNL